MSPNRRDFIKRLTIGVSSIFGLNKLEATAESLSQIEENLSLKEKPLVNKSKPKLEKTPSIKKSKSVKKKIEKIEKVCDKLGSSGVRGGLKVRCHIIAKHYPCSSLINIEEGQLLTLDKIGQAIPCSKDSSFVVGIAGDQKSTLTAGSFANRAWEFDDGTHGKITIYEGRGGEFYIPKSLVSNYKDIKLGSFLKPDNNGMYRVCENSSDSKISPDNTDFARVIDDLSSMGGYLDSGIPNVSCPYMEEEEEEWILIQTFV